jgi:hypothetical protein
MTKHTEGPWMIINGNYHPEGPITTINKSVSERICEIHLPTGKNSGRSENYKANARLIAEAPDLLEALLDMWNLINVDVSTDTIKAGTTFKTARAAIAKATGEDK